MLVKVRKAMSGKSSEQLSNIGGSEQLSLFNEAEQEYSANAAEPTVETVDVKSHPRRKRLSREELPDSVEHKEFVIGLDGKTYPECGEEVVCGELHVVPGQFSGLDDGQSSCSC